MIVETDKESYFAEEHITISGSTDPSETVNVGVKLSGITVFETTVMTSQEGMYAVTFLLLGAQPGDYTVHASTTNAEDETVFRITDGDCKLAHDLLEILSESRLKTKGLLNDLRFSADIGITVCLWRRGLEKVQRGQAAVGSTALGCTLL